MEPQQRPYAAPHHSWSDRERLLLSLLLWAASRDAGGGGRDPMGRLRLAVLLQSGAFLYDPRAHALRPCGAQDLRTRRDR
ncbi:MAG TPA: hypothetical protein VF453_04990, partial [Burkholderiaceae bacterium]